MAGRICGRGSRTDRKPVSVCGGNHGGMGVAYQVALNLGAAVASGSMAGLAVVVDAGGRTILPA